MAKTTTAAILFKIGTAGGSPGTTIGQVRASDIDWGSLNLVDSTTSTEGTKTNLAGTKEPLSGSVTVAFDGAEAGIAAAASAWAAKTLISFGVTYADAGSAVIYSDGFVTNISGPAAGVDTLSEVTITLMGSGPATYTA